MPASCHSFPAAFTDSKPDPQHLDSRSCARSGLVRLWAEGRCPEPEGYWVCLQCPSETPHNQQPGFDSACLQTLDRLAGEAGPLRQLRRVEAQLLPTLLQPPSEVSKVLIRLGLSQHHRRLWDARGSSRRHLRAVYGVGRLAATALFRFAHRRYIYFSVKTCCKQIQAQPYRGLGGDRRAGLTNLMKREGHHR